MRDGVWADAGSVIARRHSHCMQFNTLRDTPTHLEYGNGKTGVHRDQQHLVCARQEGDG